MNLNMKVLISGSHVFFVLRIWCLFDPWIPNPNFESLVTIFGVKSALILFVNWLDFFSVKYLFKKKQFSMKLVTKKNIKKIRLKIFLPSLLLLWLDLGSRMDKNQDPGSAILPFFNGHPGKSCSRYLDPSTVLDPLFSCKNARIRKE